MNDPMQRYLDVSAAYVRSLLEQHYRLLEQACEAAIQGGKHGVLVDRSRNIYRVDARVPYGQIYDATACGEENVQQW